MLNPVGYKEDLPENTRDMFWAIGDLRKRGRPLPHKVAAYRYANGAVPEGELVDATARFMARRELVARVDEASDVPVYASGGSGPQLDRLRASEKHTGALERKRSQGRQQPNGLGGYSNEHRD